MNIFVVHTNPYMAARMLCDQHVVKMTLESVQMLNTISSIFGKSYNYAPTHEMHPCTIWARSTYGNYLWLLAHACALGAEYTYRYGRRHASMDKFPELLLPEHFYDLALTPFVQCMPESYKHDNAVTAYRTFYVMDKKFARWNKNRRAPFWHPLYEE